jgi:hypothetical protein
VDERDDGALAVVDDGEAIHKLEASVPYPQHTKL